MKDIERDELECEVKRHKEIAQMLEDKLNKKIDEVTKLRATKNSMNAQIEDLTLLVVELTSSEFNAELKSEVARLKKSNRLDK